MGLFIAKPKSYVLCTKAQLLIFIYKQDVMFSSLISVPCPLYCAVLNYYTIRYIIIHKALRPMIAGFVLYYIIWIWINIITHTRIVYIEGNGDSWFLDSKVIPFWKNYEWLVDSTYFEEP